MNDFAVGGACANLENFGLVFYKQLLPGQLRRHSAGLLTVELGLVNSSLCLQPCFGRFFPSKCHRPRRDINEASA